MPSLLEAIHAKYGGDGNETASDVPIEIFVPRVGPRKCIPRLLVLNDCDVDSAGDEDALQKTCAGVLEIDLAHNRLQCWNEVSRILQYTPSVTFLNLSFNSLCSPLKLSGGNPSPGLGFPTLPRLTALILIGTKVSWDSVWFLVRQAPALQELHLSLNDFTNVDLKMSVGGVGAAVAGAGAVAVGEDEDDDGMHNSGHSSTDSGNESCSDDDNGFCFPHIRKVMFDGNPIDSWKQVSKLGSCFPSLRHMGLADCPIQGIDQEGHQAFENLQSLSMTNTGINSLTDLSYLNLFPSLTELRLQGVPLLSDMTEHERRQILVAMLPNVKKLNGGAPISIEEREDAERAFIRRFAQSQEDKPKRYHDLVAVHGELAPLPNVQLKPTTRVKIHFKFGDNVFTKMVNVYQTTFELKTQLESVIRVKPSNMRLFYIDVEMNGSCGCSEEMRYPQKKLYSYNMQNQDEIHIELKNMP